MLDGGMTLKAYFAIGRVVALLPEAFHFISIAGLLK